MVELTTSRVEKKGKFVPPKAVPKMAGRRRPGAPLAATDAKKVRFGENSEKSQKDIPGDASSVGPGQKSASAQPVSILKTPTISSPPPSQASLVTSSQEALPEQTQSATEILTPPLTQDTSISSSEPISIPVVTPIPGPTTITSPSTSQKQPHDDDLPPPVTSELLADGEELDSLSHSVSSISSAARPFRFAPKIQNATESSTLMQSSNKSSTSIAIPGTRIEAPVVVSVSVPGSSSAQISSDSISNQPSDEQQVPRDPSELSLKELIKVKLEDGKLSTFEKSRRQAVREARIRKKQSRGKSITPNASPLNATPPPKQNEEIAIPTTFAGPRVRMVNGVVVIDEASLVVESGNADNRYDDMQRVEEGSLRYVTSASFRTKKREGKIVWTDEMTNRFFDGLSYFGTNFALIALMFPGMTRAQIKLKYNHEEKVRPMKLTNAIYNRKTPDSILRDRMRAAIERQKKTEVSENQFPIAISSSSSSQAIQNSDTVVVKAEGSPAPQPQPEEVSPESIQENHEMGLKLQNLVSAPKEGEPREEQEDPTLSLFQKTVARLPGLSKSTGPTVKPKIAPKASRVRRLRPQTSANASVEVKPEISAEAPRNEVEPTQVAHESTRPVRRQPPTIGTTRVS